MEPTILLEAVEYFKNPANCYEYMVPRRWPNGVTCPTCGSKSVTFQPKYNRWQCSVHHALRCFTLKTGTIMEDSPIGLDKWLPAIWLICSIRNGISSYELHRALNVTQKTAWFMLQRIRLAMQDENSGGTLGGEVEVDETFIGGKARNMHKDKKERVLGGGKGEGGKTIVAAVLERGGKVRTKVIDQRRKRQLHELVKHHVVPGSKLYSDELKSYDGLESSYLHETVNHAVEYVRGNVHTNGMENFWSLLKQSINGTYISVEPFHLFRYVDEQAFRFNNRLPMSDSERFGYLVKKIVGKRLTYAKLTGKVEERPDAH